MSSRDEWKIDYYRGALDAAKRESETLVEHARVMKGRVEQFERAVREIEALRERIQRDEELLRMALKALEHGAWDTLRGRNAAYAIRERLEQKENSND